MASGRFRTDGTLEISSAGGRTVARFVPAANMVCSSLRHDGVELLDLRRGLQTYAEAGKTMGIPLLYPWANRLHKFGYEAAGKSVTLSESDERIPRDSQGLPIHGVVPGLMQWDVLDPAGRNTIRARLPWRSSDLLELFPYQHEVQLELTVTDGQLTIATSIHATDGDAVPVSFGYHPYLRIDGIPRESWEVQLGASRRLLLDPQGIPTGEREPVQERHTRLGHADWDHAFDGLDEPGQFVVAAGGTQLSVTFRTGYRFAQVFAPAEQNLIAFEPMTAASDALNSGDGLRIAQPGETYRAEFAVTVASET